MARYLIVNNWQLKDAIPANVGKHLMIEVEKQMAFGLNGVVFLGDMFAPDVAPDAFTRSPAWNDAFGIGGWFRMLAQLTTVYYVPAVSDKFLCDDDFAKVRAELDPIKFALNQVLLLPPDNRTRPFIAAPCYTDEFWRPSLTNLVEVHLPGRLNNTLLDRWVGRLIYPLLEPTDDGTLVAGLLAGERIRAKALVQHQSAGIAGIIHGGHSAYFGQYGPIWCGSPDGPAYSLVLDTTRPDLSRLVRTL